LLRRGAVQGSLTGIADITTSIRRVAAMEAPSGVPLRSTRTGLDFPLMILLRDWKRLAVCALAVAVALPLAVSAARAASEIATGPSGLPLPRFVSLKADKINVHVGPAKTYDVTWIYTRVGLPVEITAEFENWRRIRDGEGAEGWVYHSLLSGRRTAVVQAKESLVPLREAGDLEGGIIAQLQSGVVGTVKKCNGTWCRISGDGFDGWIEQQRLWGVYPNEKVE
jgi:SH3-like domain-containing protein